MADNNEICPDAKPHGVFKVMRACRHIESTEHTVKGVETNDGLCPEIAWRHNWRRCPYRPARAVVEDEEK